MQKMNQQKLRRSIGMQIYRARIARKISQEVLAETVDVSRVFISKLENGNQSAKIDTYFRIACALDIPLCELFRGSDEKGSLDNLMFLLGDCSDAEVHAYTEILRVIKSQSRRTTTSSGNVNNLRKLKNLQKKP